MIFLIFSILISSSIFVIFKLFKRFQINNFQAITFNYLIASVFGILFFVKNDSLITLFTEPWLPLAIIEGVLFIAVFILFAFSSQKAGIAITAMSSKMSVIIPVIFGIVLYLDSLRIFKIFGIIIMLIAFYLTLRRDNNNIQNAKFILLPIMIFLGNGMVDTFMKITEHYYLSDDKGYFITAIFIFALMIGSAITLFNIIFKREKVQFKNFVGGSILGIINYLASLFKLLALSYMESSVVFPVLNSGVVALSAIAGLFLFHEKLSVINRLGIALAIIAIFMIYLS